MLAVGVLAGAAGTLALDIYTYFDILSSARPPSTLPAATVKKLAEKANLPLLSADDEDAGNRRSGAGALLGYGVGIGAGVGYAALRPAFENWLPWPVAGVLLGAATLALSEGSATALGATDWAEWTPSEWLADIIPRTLYGLTVAYVVENLGEEDD